MANYRENKGKNFNNRGSSDRFSGPATMFDAVCSDCGQNCKVPFRPTGTKPVLCSRCFDKSKGNDRGGSSYNSRPSYGGGTDYQQREMFSAVCEKCNQPCQIPFQPRNGRPVFCSNCFRNSTESIDSRNDSRRPSYDRPAISRPAPQSNVQLDAVHAKLDQILALLSSTPAKKTAKTKEVTIEEEAAEVLASVEPEEVKEEKAEKKEKKSAVKKATVKKPAKKTTKKASK